MINLKCLSKVFFSCFAVTFIFVSPTYAAEEIIKIHGSSTLTPIVEKAAEKYMDLNPNIKIRISETNSSDGIQALLENQCDIAMASRDFSKDELKFIIAQKLQLDHDPIALDAIVPIVHPSNSISDLSRTQLKDIYTSHVTGWLELGTASKDPIVPTSRDEESGTFIIFQQYVLDGEKVSPFCLEHTSQTGTHKTVANNPKAIGYISFSNLDKTVKPLSMNGVEASMENIRNGEWTFVRPLYLITKHNTSKKVHDFIFYLAHSEQGQKVMEDMGCVPMLNEFE